MAKKDRAVVRVINPELRLLGQRLKSTRTAIKLMGEQEDEIKKEITEITQDWEIDKEGTIFLCAPGESMDIESVEVSLIPSGRNSLNRDLLLENGVMVSTIEASYKYSPYTTIEVDIGKA